MTARSEPLPASPPADASLGRLFRDFFKIGVLSFGGATAQIAMLHTLAVDQRKWLTEQHYLNGLGFAMLLPGPEAQQLATYVGWRARGVAGGILAGSLFVLPGAAIMLALSLLYIEGRGIGLVDGIFRGIKAAVLAIVLAALIKIGKRALKDGLAYGVAAAAFLAFGFLAVPFPVLLLLGAAIRVALPGAMPAAAGSAAPFEHRAALRMTGISLGLGALAWLTPLAVVAVLLGPGHSLVEIGAFFARLAVLSFGGAYALLVWLADAAPARGWVSAAEMIDGLGLAETTPGPTILVTQFIGTLAGYRLAPPLPAWGGAVLGAMLTTWMTFAPSFMLIFAGAPWIDRLLRNRHLAAALGGVTAVVAGLIAWLAVWFALNTIAAPVHFAGYGPLRWPVPGGLDVVALLMAVAALVLQFVFKRGMLQIILALAIAGALI